VVITPSPFKIGHIVTQTLLITKMQEIIYSNVQDPWITLYT